MKQAIIIIHGIGEQHPMDTLRGFVETVVNELSDKEKIQKWFKPHDSTDLLEQRRVTISASRTRPSTDFYEFYWAHHLSDTKVMHVFRWVLRLLFSNPMSFSKMIAFLWVQLWVLIALFIWGLISFGGYIPGVFYSPALEKGNLLISGLSILIYSLMRYFLIRYMGDAASYFSGTPEHVKTRNDILQDGINMVKHLSESGKYDRIVIVGHSLGSVIAYDLLKYLWADYNTEHGSPEVVDDGPLTKMEEMLNDWKEDPKGERIEEYQKLQEELWIQQRKHGNPWLVSDFITLGSPLTHASFLISNNKAELAVRKNDRELPTCPPIMETGKIHFFNKAKNYKNKAGENKSIYFLHHAALFAPTRWTNLYFPGDPISGPLREAFGKGIKDIKVMLPKRWLSYLPLSHTKYWDARPFSDRINKLNEDSSMIQLINAMRLNSRNMLRPLLFDNSAEEEEDDAITKDEK